MTRPGGWGWPAAPVVPDRWRRLHWPTGEECDAWLLLGPGGGAMLARDGVGQWRWMAWQGWVHLGHGASETMAVAIMAAEAALEAT